MQNFQKLRDFLLSTCTISNVGLFFILRIQTFFTKLVKNYKMWIMQQPQCKTYCNLFLGDIKQLLFQMDLSKHFVLLNGEPKTLHRHHTKSIF
mgnify:FL=1